MALVLARVPRLAFSFDPLIAEAKRRAWRRRVVVGVVVLAAAAVGVTLGVRAFNGPSAGTVAGHGPLSGSWHGTSWKIRATDSGDGRYAMTVLVAGSRVASRGGRFYGPGPGGAPIRLGWTSNTQGRLPFVAGAVAITPCCKQESAAVTIRLSNGSVETTTATVPPYTLTHAPGIAFFLLPTPGDARPTAIIARNAAGRVIASWKRAH
jgi:hypothetical protein